VGLGHQQNESLFAKNINEAESITDREQDNFVESKTIGGRRFSTSLRQPVILSEGKRKKVKGKSYAGGIFTFAFAFLLLS
jgi:hypothetical protein